MLGGTGNKGSSTSRNRNSGVNQSFNVVPKLKEAFMMGGSKNNLGLKEELAGLNSSLDMSARTSRNRFFSPGDDLSNSKYTIQRKMGELKDTLADKESELEYLKQTLKHNKSEKLKQENKMLYEK